MCGTSPAKFYTTDSVVKEYGSIYNTGKGTAGSRLRMQAVRKDSKDQEIFTLQHAGSGRRMDVKVSVFNWEIVIWQSFWNTWSWQIMEASGRHLKGCGDFFFNWRCGGNRYMQQENTVQKNISSRHKAIKPLHPPEMLFKELITLCWLYLFPPYQQSVCLSFWTSVACLRGQ